MVVMIGCSFFLFDFTFDFLKFCKTFAKLLHKLKKMTHRTSSLSSSSSSSNSSNSSNSSIGEPMDLRDDDGIGGSTNTRSGRRSSKNSHSSSETKGSAKIIAKTILRPSTVSLERIVVIVVTASTPSGILPVAATVYDLYHSFLRVVETKSVQLSEELFDRKWRIRMTVDDASYRKLLAHIAVLTSDSPNHFEFNVQLLP